MFSWLNPTILNKSIGKHKIMNKNIFNVMLENIKLIKQKTNICQIKLKIAVL